MPVEPSSPEKLGPVISRGQAIPYQRVSTVGQGGEDKSSWDRQNESFDRWCAAHPEYTPIKATTVAVSGAEPGRFQWLFDGIKKNKYGPGDVLVVESINRFGREAMQDTMQNLFEIWKTGIKTAFCDHNNGQILDSTDFNTDQSTIFNLAVRIGTSRQLHEDKKKWSQGAVDKNHRAIYDGRLNDSYFKPREPGKRVLYPFWLDYHPEYNNGNGGFELNDEVRWIRRMFELALKHGRHTVAQKLNQEGFKVKDGNTIGNYLTMRKVIGEWYPTQQVKDPKTGKRRIVQVGEVKRDVFKPAITEKLFNAVQERINDRRINVTPNTGGGGLLNLFAGSTFCHQCGGLMRRVSQSSGYEPKLRCSVHKRDPKACPENNGITYNEDNLFKMLERFRWEEYFRDDRKVEQVAQITAEQSKAQAVLNEANQQVETLLKAQDSYADQGMAWPQRQQDRLDAAQQSVSDAKTALVALSVQLSTANREKSGKEAAEAIQENLRDFILNHNDLDKRKEFNNWFRSTGLVFVFNPSLNKLEPKWGIDLGAGSVQTKGKLRTLTRFQATSELVLSAMQGEKNTFMREEYENRLEEWKRTGVMEEHMSMAADGSISEYVDGEWITYPPAPPSPSDP